MKQCHDMMILLHSSSFQAILAAKECLERDAIRAIMMGLASTPSLIRLMKLQRHLFDLMPRLQTSFKSSTSRGMNCSVSTPRVHIALPSWLILQALFTHSSPYGTCLQNQRLNMESSARPMPHAGGETSMMIAQTRMLAVTSSQPKQKLVSAIL